MTEATNLEKKCVALIEKYALLIILVFFALTALCFKPATKLMGTISTTLSTLLPDHYPTVKISNNIKEHFKKRTGGDLVVIIDSPHPEKNLALVNSLAAYLSKNPEIERVQYLKPGFDFFDKHKLLFLDQSDLVSIRDRTKKKIQKEKLGGLYLDFEESADSTDPFSFEDLSKKYKNDYTQGTKSPYYANSDQTSFAFWIYPKSRDTSLKFYNQFYNNISQYIDQYDFNGEKDSFKMGYAGSIKTRIDEYTNLVQDLKLCGAISSIGIFLVLMLYFKRVLAVFLIFIPLVSGILMGFAICSLFVDSMNVVTSFLFSILFGLGVDIGIHMLSRYLHEREAGRDLHASIYDILFKTGRSSTTAVLTTVASFFILMINDFRGFSEFGLIAGVGLLITLLCYLILFPAVLIYAEKWHLLKLKSHRHERRQDFLDRVPRVPFVKTIIGGSIVIAIVSLIMLPKLGFEWNYGILKIQIPQTQWARAKLKEISGRVNSGAAILINGPEEAALLTEAFKQKKLETKNSTIDRFRSYYDLNPSDQKEKMALLKEIDALLADDALNILKGEDKEMVTEFRDAIKKTEYIKESEIPQEVAENFFGVGEHKGTQVGFILPNPKLELDDGRNAINFYNEAHILKTPEKTFYAASEIGRAHV